MIRRIDIAFYLAALAFAIATAAGAATADDQNATEPAFMGAISQDLVRSIVETWTTEQIESAETEQDDGTTRYEVSARWQGDILLNAPGEVDFEVRRLSSRPFRGPTVVRLVLHVDGELYRSMTVTVDCRAYRDVVVTTRTVRRGTLLDSDAFVVEERDVTSLKHGSFAALEDLGESQAARPIGAGEIVSHRHVEPIPIIHRGDDINMSVTTDNMFLLATGIAMEDGGVGERIRVRNLDSNKVVYGEIVDSQTVRINGG